ncbi:hypothetical protein F5B20DRAFT_586200 [Whalleya microplaca]|nr:hypothetical protein F5B20DRAFT_586200 [Whalleya microplaca]
MNLNGYALVVGGCKNPPTIISLLYDRHSQIIASGIGKACAKALAMQGSTGIMIADIDSTAAETVASECKALAKFPHFRSGAVHMDVTCEKSVTLAVEHTSRQFGRIDYCVTSAGIGAEHGSETSETALSEFKRFMDTNVTGTFLVNRAVSASMRLQDPRPAVVGLPERGVTRGVIVNMGSLASFLPSPGLVQYTTSKHAVLGLSRSAALDNRAKEGVPELEQMINSLVPMGRMARPSEVADTVVFLCSPLSSYITGSIIVVDGGTTLGSRFGTAFTTPNKITIMASSTEQAEGFVTHGFPAPGLPRTQRHITGHDNQGKSIFLTTDCGDHHRVMGKEQAVANIIYSTQENPVELNGEVDIQRAMGMEPPLHYHNGTVVRMVDFGPGLESPLHRALSIDYGVVLEGVFELELDSGEKRVMRRGDVSVQRAAAHKWRNITGNGTLPGRMLYVLLDCNDVVVNGVKLEGFLGELEKEYAGR